jgi:integrase
MTTETKRERGRGRIFTRKGSAMLWCAYYLRGKEFRESTGETDPSKAEKYLKHRLKEVGAAQIGARTFVSPQQERIRVSALLDSLEADYRLRGKCNPQTRCQVTQAREYFGNMRALEITPELVDRYIEERLAKGARPATINRTTQVLAQSFKLAVDRRQLSNAVKVRRLSEAGNERQGFFAEREVRTVMENLPPYLADFTLFGFLTGWRSGEIKSLIWPDVDGDCIRLRPENSKNGEGRVIMLEGELAELMERRKAARAVQTPTGPMLATAIFHRKGLSVRSFYRSWVRACCMAGMGKMVCPGPAGAREPDGARQDACNGAVEAETGKRTQSWKCTQCAKTWKYGGLKYIGKLFHDLRRTSVRNMIRAGVSEKVAMTVSGHKTHSMLSRYNIVSETDIRQALQRTEEYRKNKVEESKVVAMPARVQ